MVAGRLPPHRQGHHPPALRVLAGDAAVGRGRAAEGLGRRRVAARRRREDEQDRPATSSSRSTSSTPSASTASATTSWPTPRTARTATSPTRAWSGATTPTSPTTSATSPPRVATVVEVQVRRHRAGAGGRQPTGGGGGRRRGRAPSPAWDVVAPSRALDATWQLIRATNAHLEAAEPWKAEPGPEVDAVLGDALEALRIVTVLASPAMPATAQEIWERLGLPGAVTDQRIPADVAWGGYPGGLPVVKGAPLFPRSRHDATVRGSTRTATSPRRRGRRGGRRGRGGRRRRRWSRWGATGRRRWRRWTSPAASPASTPRSGCTPTRPATASTRSPICSTGRSHRSQWASAGSTTTTTTRRATDQREAFAAQIALAHGLGLPLVDPHPRGVADTFDILDAEGVPARTIFHCFTGGPDEARACLDRGAFVSFSGIVTFPGAADVREAAPLVPARPPAGRDRQPLPRPRAQPGSATARRGCRSSGPAWPRCGASAPTSCGRRRRRRRGPRRPRRSTRRRGGGTRRPRLVAPSLRSSHLIRSVFLLGRVGTCRPPDRERNLQTPTSDRRRLVFASVLTIAVLPAILLVNRRRRGRRRRTSPRWACPPAEPRPRSAGTAASDDPRGALRPQFLTDAPGSAPAAAPPPIVVGTRRSRGPGHRHGDVRRRRRRRRVPATTASPWAS